MSSLIFDINDIDSGISNILTIIGLGDWQNAQKSAHLFIKKHPQHPVLKTLNQLLSCPPAKRKILTQCYQALKTTQLPPAIITLVLLSLITSLEDEQRMEIKQFNHPNQLIDAGIYLSRLHHYTQAIALLKIIENRCTQNTNFHFSLGCFYQQTNQLTLAKHHFNMATELKPDFASAQYNLSRVLLTMGDYQQAWPLFERWRFQSQLYKNFSRHKQFTQPKWQGESLADQTVLVWTDQGYGDAIMMMRYLATLKQQKARIILEVHPALLPLIKAQSYISEGVTPVYTGQSDYQCSILSLPAIFTEHHLDVTNTTYIDVPQRHYQW